MQLESIFIYVTANVQAQLEEQAKKLEAAEKEAAAMKDTSLRTLADMENLRSRTKQQVDDARQFALQGFSKAILDVADNLERALDSVPPELLEQAAAAPDDAFAKNLSSLHNGVGLSQKVGVRYLCACIGCSCWQPRTRLSTAVERNRRSTVPADHQISDHARPWPLPVARFPRYGRHRSFGALARV